MTDVRLELPFPPKELSPNARPNRWVKAKSVREYRDACGWAAVAVFGPGRLRKPRLTPPVRAAVTFVVPTRHKRDEDNLLAMLKPAWDGLVDAGVLAGDDSERFSVESTFIAVTEEAIHKNRSYVIVVLRSL